MKKTKHLIGIFASILIIVLLGLNILLSLLNETLSLTEHISSFCISFCYIIIFLLLRNTLVIDFKHKDLSLLLILIILSYSIFSVLNFIFIFIPVNILIIYLILGVTVVIFILYILFINKIFRIDKSKFPHIESLKNFGLIYLITFLGQIIISAIIEFTQSYHLNFLEFILPIFPVYFLLEFFMRMYHEKDTSGN